MADGGWRMAPEERAMIESGRAMAMAGASVGRGVGVGEMARAHGVYYVECRRADGTLRWRDEAVNLVTTVGKNDALDKHLAGSSYTAAWYMGLISLTSYTTGVAAGDTMSSHSGWAEDEQYDEAARVTMAWDAAASGSKATSSARVFTISATTTIKGCFLCSDSTKGGTGGILYSAGLFTGGDKAVADNDTLNITYTASL